MSTVRLESIEDTKLCRHREDEDDAERIRMPQRALLTDAHLLRSSAFAPSRLSIECPDEFVCPQLPAPQGLFLYQPAGALRVRDAMLFGEILRRFYSDGSEDRFTCLSLSQAAVAMGYAGRIGGQQRRLVRESLSRLVESTLKWAEIDADGVVRELYWHLVDQVLIHYEPERSVGSAGVLLSQITAELVEKGYLQYLNADACRRLVARDDLAARLWMMLECERLGDVPFHYHVFRAPLGGAAESSNALFIAEVTGLHLWCNRRRVAQRLKLAIKTIMAIDEGRYQMTLSHGRQPGMYVMAVRRHPRRRQYAGAVDSGGTERNAPRYDAERPPVPRGTLGSPTGNTARFSEERP